MLKVLGITLDKTQLAFTRAGQTAKLIATLMPSDASDDFVMWETSNSAVAAVDGQGLVTAVADGTEVIKATSHDGEYTAECTVRINTEETGVEAFIERMYTVALNRRSDAGGKADWINGLNEHRITGAQAAKGFMLSDVFNGFANSDEFKKIVKSFGL